MPELPEVAVLAHDLSSFLGASRLTSVNLHGRSRLLAKIVPRNVQAALKSMVGSSVHFSSLGKWLTISNNSSSIELHLGMTGQFLVRQLRSEELKHLFITWTFGAKRCHFLDVRRFARMYQDHPEPSWGLGGYCPAKGFFLASPEAVRRRLGSHLRGFRNVARIAWLLRFGRDTGVGNYLANEALGELSLSPYHPCRDEAEALLILRQCQVIARRSYRAGGTSFSNGYFRIDGTRGEFTRHLAYYQNRNFKRHRFQGRSVYSRFTNA